MISFCGLELRSPFLLAPMAGITDPAFRSVCADYGAALTYTEMVSAKGLIYQDKKSAELLRLGGSAPCIAQLFGSEPEIMAAAAEKALDISPFDGIDINMGCPVPKIVGNGEGSALMKDMPLAGRIISAVKNAVRVPVSVKFRSGFDAEHINAAEFARMAEASGADAVCVHGRTRMQMYSGLSDRAVIAEVRRAVSVPVAASGDALSPQACMDILRDTGADAVMVARGALGRPWIFEDCEAELQGAELREHTAEELTATLLRHAELICAQKGEGRAIREMRKHGMWYLAGLRGAKSLKLRMAQALTLADIAEICDEVRQSELKMKR